MTSAKFQRICERIASDVTHEHEIRMGGVTPEQVALVANGTERTMSHPIISAIRGELRKWGVEPV